MGHTGGSPPPAGITDVELFYALTAKADRRFSRVTSAPIQFSTSRSSRSSPDFNKAFEMYTRLWMLQQELRPKLVENKFQRWEIGEIASRIAQLYYLQYQRTSDASFLSEAYLFYDAILAREYFKESASFRSAENTSLAKKQLRFLTRFFAVCLLLGRREMTSHLAALIRSLFEERQLNFRDADAKELKKAVHEVVRFLKADSQSMNMRPLRYSYAFDCNPKQIAHVTDMSLTDAVLCSYQRHGEVKFMELTLDSYRMLQCLEWDPCGSYATPMDPASDDSGFGKSYLKSAHDLKDFSLPPNPKKVTLYRPSITQYLLVLATVCEELPANGILLVYLSARGGDNMSLTESTMERLSSLDMMSEMNFSTDDTLKSIPTESFGNTNEGIWLGGQENGGSNCLYPCDLIPFTRKPLFLIVESAASSSFKVIHGAEIGVRAAILVSPRSQAFGSSAPDAIRHHNGSQFTIFLTAPLEAFSTFLGISCSNISKETQHRFEGQLLKWFNEWASVLVQSDSLDPVWHKVVGEPFLRRLLLRFIFCRAVLALHAATFRQPECLPECMPPLPSCVLPSSRYCRPAVMELSSILGESDKFQMTETAWSC